jgi:hypothetical protein
VRSTLNIHLDEKPVFVRAGLAVFTLCGAVHGGATAIPDESRRRGISR